MLARLDARMIFEKCQQSVFLFEYLISLNHSIFIRTQHIDIPFERDIDLLCFCFNLRSARWIDLGVVIKLLKQAFLTAISHELLYELKDGH